MIFLLEVITLVVPLFPVSFKTVVYARSRATMEYSRYILEVSNAHAQTGGAISWQPSTVIQLHWQQWRTEDLI